MNICCVCRKRANSWLVHDKFWDQIYCYGHQFDGTLRCDTCHQFKQAGDTGYRNLGDDQIACSKCCSIAIKNLEEFKPIIENVHKFYESLNMMVDRDVPILLVDGNEMRSRQGKTYAGKKLFGLCQRFKLEILVLSGLSDVAMGGILAHEMMHAWLELQGCEPWKWKRSVEEGICQVMWFKWMEWFCSSSYFDTRYKTNEQTQYARKLKQYISLTLERSKDKVYGKGFRDALKVAEMLGFEETLTYIAKEKKFPVTKTPTIFCCFEFLCG